MSFWETERYTLFLESVPICRILLYSGLSSFASPSLQFILAIDSIYTNSSELTRKKWHGYVTQKVRGGETNHSSNKACKKQLLKWNHSNKTNSIKSHKNFSCAALAVVSLYIMLCCRSANPFKSSTKVLRTIKHFNFQFECNFYKLRLWNKENNVCSNL